jgi:hypothetical protein
VIESFRGRRNYAFVALGSFNRNHYMVGYMVVIVGYGM